MMSKHGMSKLHKLKLTTIVILKVMKEKTALLMGLLSVIVAVVLLSLVPPQLLRVIIDRHLVLKEMDGLLELALAYVAVLVLIGIFDFFKGGLLTILGQRIVKRLRMAMTLKLERMHTTYFSANTPGAITSRLTNDVENINSLFADGVISMVIDCLKIIGILGSIAIFSVKLGLVALCLVPLIYWVTRAFQRRMLVAQMKNLEQLGRVNAHISETLKNAHMIKSFSKESYMEELYGQRLEANFHTIERVNFYDSCYAPIIQVTRAVVIAMIVLLSSAQLNFLGISLGMVAACIDLISNLFGPIETLGMELQNIQKGIAGVRRINDFYDEAEEAQKQDDLRAEVILGQKNGQDLNFKNVTFSYGNGSAIFSDFNLVVAHGSHTTIVGRTGVGKTTLFRLVMGLLQPTSGTITIGDIDVYQIPNSEKRKLFGYVEQHFSFIRGTVADQITLGDTSISREQVIEAVSFVGLHEYVSQMEKGYDTAVTSDGDFSQGQKQLLTIARAIVSKPAILLLDEVTANMDSVTESQIVTVLKKASEGRTVLTITHRTVEGTAVDGTVGDRAADGKMYGTVDEKVDGDTIVSLS